MQSSPASLENNAAKQPSLHDLLSEKTHTAKQVDATRRAISQATGIDRDDVLLAIGNENHQQFVLTMLEQEPALLEDEDILKALTEVVYLTFRFAQSHFDVLASNIYEGVIPFQDYFLKLRDPQGNNLFHHFSESQDGENFLYPQFYSSQLLSTTISLAGVANDQGLTPLHNLIRFGSEGLGVFQSAANCEHFPKDANDLKGVAKKSDTLVFHALSAFIPKNPEEQSAKKLALALQWLRLLSSVFGSAYCTSKSKLLGLISLKPDAYVAKYLKDELKQSDTGQELLADLNSLKLGNAIAPPSIPDASQPNAATPNGSAKKKKKVKKKKKPQDNDKTGTDTQHAPPSASMAQLVQDGVGGNSPLHTGEQRGAPQQVDGEECELTPMGN